MVEPITILLADDHPFIRKGIASTLASEPGLNVVGEASSGDEAHQLCRELKPRVLLLDMSMPGKTPSELVTELAQDCPDTRVIVLSAFAEDAYVQQMLKAGIAGYILKDEATEAVVGAIRTVAQGATAFSQSIVDKLRQQTGETESTLRESLTEREMDILRLMVRGWDNAHVAEELHLAEQTVRNYASRVYSKLQVTSRAEAIVWAIEHGMGRQ